MLNKHIPFAECDLKFLKDGEGVFEGYVSTYGNVDHDNDVIEKGAFSETVETQRVIPIFYGHSWIRGGLPIGKSTGFSDDDRGLYMKGALTMARNEARDVRALVEDGVLSGFSVGMRVPRDAKSQSKRDDGVRIIKSARLIEVSILPFPANEEAGIESMKSMVSEIETISDCEHFLRDVGMSHQAAKRFISKIKEVHLRDVGSDADEIAILKARLAKAERQLAIRSRNGDIEAMIRGM